MEKSIQKTTSRLLAVLALFGIYAGLVPSAANALDLNITAMFKPDPSNPLRNEFKNTTQQSGYCDQLPAFCVNPPLVSFRVPLRFRTAMPIPANHPLQTQGAMFGVPGQWRRLSVIHTVTGKAEEVEVRLAGIGTVHEVSVPVQTLVGDPPNTSSYTSWGKLWEGGNWGEGVGPCKSTGYHGASPYIYGFFLRVEETNGLCAKKALFDIPQLDFAFLDVGYQLRTPKPLEMPTGVYVGSMPYTVGPGGDISAGNNLLPQGDSLINLIFTLTVEHELKVDIPPGGEKVQLVPEGGWQSWLQAGQRPVRLFRDQLFHISASSRFKMQLDCEIDLYDCVIRDVVSRRPVKLKTYVSLPPGLTDLAGRPVKYELLRAGPSYARHYQPGFYVDRAPGVLHFEIAPHEMSQMLQPGVASTYSGNVTVIWDSEV